MAPTTHRLPPRRRRRARVLRAALGGHRPRVVHQPVVDRRDEQVVAAEALARGPAGTASEAPDRLSDAARPEVLGRHCRFPASVPRPPAVGLDPRG